MNCLDYRRVLLAGDGETPGMRTHRLQCQACTELLNEHDELERELRRGLEVGVPSGFEERLARPFAASRRRFLAAAAVGALAVGVGTYAWLGRDDPLALACIQFVMMDEAKSIMMGAMPRGAAESALAGTLPLERLEQVGQIRHVGPCPFNGGTAYHVVLAVPQGKVTLLVMPETRLAGGVRATHEGLYARVLSLEKGSVGIVGADSAVVNSVAGALKS
jgi:hypothetical protein